MTLRDQTSELEQRLWRLQAGDHLCCLYESEEEHHLPFSATEDSLKEVFSQFGIVESKIITDKVTCQSKGFGFLEMATIQGAVSAIAKMHGSVMGGRELKVSEAKPQVPREDPDMKRGHVDSGFRG